MKSKSCDIITGRLTLTLTSGSKTFPSLAEHSSYTQQVTSIHQTTQDSIILYGFVHILTAETDVFSSQHVPQALVNFSHMTNEPPGAQQHHLLQCPQPTLRSLDSFKSVPLLRDQFELQDPFPWQQHAGKNPHCETLGGDAQISF